MSGSKGSSETVPTGFDPNAFVQESSGLTNIYGESLPAGYSIGSGAGPNTILDPQGNYAYEYMWHPEQRDFYASQGLTGDPATWANLTEPITWNVPGGYGGSVTSYPLNWDFGDGGGGGGHGDNPPPTRNPPPQRGETHPGLNDLAVNSYQQMMGGGHYGGIIPQNMRSTALPGDPWGVLNSMGIRDPRTQSPEELMAAASSFGTSPWTNILGSSTRRG